MSVLEVNFDGLVGPTHHYGGLGFGNVASHSHAHQASSPLRGALQGLEKMWMLAERGLPQAFLPPCVRPNRAFLERQGFVGELRDQLKGAAEQSPKILSAAYSSAFMWTANAATVSSSNQIGDGHLHLAIANLAANLHRAQEAVERFAWMKFIFRNSPSTVLHPSLSSCWPLRDEGAANHLYLTSDLEKPGYEFFVHGHDEMESSSSWVGNALPHFLARQGRLASEAVARLHRLSPNRFYLLKQSPQAIDAGVFHNDVIATSHENLLIYHEHAFVDSDEVLDRFQARFDEEAKSNGGNGRAPANLVRILVGEHELALKDAVECYLFNSQIVSLGTYNQLGTKRMLLVAPQQCRDLEAARRLIERWIADPSHPIGEVVYVPLDQSMANGGGPACLRLRMQMTEQQRHELYPVVWLTAQRRDWLEGWIRRGYPERLTIDDLARVDFAEHALAVVAELHRELGWAEGLASI